MSTNLPVSEDGDSVSFLGLPLFFCKRSSESAELSSDFLRLLDLSALSKDACQSSCKLQNHILWLFFSYHMNVPILTILTSVQAVKCKTKIGLIAGMGNGSYAERVLEPII